MIYFHITQINGNDFFFQKGYNKTQNFKKRSEFERGTFF